MARRAGRPVFLNLFRIRLPAAAVTSIAHRASGILLALAVPFSLYLLDLSLRDPGGFERAGALLASPWSRGAAALLAWALAHHWLAGVRFLLIDVDAGVERRAARLGAWLVNLAAAAVGAAVAVGAWA